MTRDNQINNGDADIENSVCSTEPTTSGSASTTSSNENTSEANITTKDSPSKKRKIIKKKNKKTATTDSSPAKNSCKKINKEEDIAPDKKGSVSNAKKEEHSDDVSDDDSAGHIGRRRFIVTTVVVLVYVCIAIAFGVHFGKGGKKGSEQGEVTLVAVGPIDGAMDDGYGETYYPNANAMLPCDQDPSCGVIMEGLGPVIMPGTMAIFDVPDTCQSRVRDWLRSSSADLKYDRHRIRQRYALGMIYCELDGHLWLENQMWLSDIHECEWYNKLPSDRNDDYQTSSYSIVNRTESYPFKLHSLYDTCDAEGQLEVLILPRNQLHGTLPSELSMLSTLKILDLSHNLLYGSIPQDFSALSNLQYVDLSHNMFSVHDDFRNYPGLLSRYPRAKYLDLSYNNFDGELPNDIPVRMPNIQKLYLQNNRFNGTIPETLGDLKYHLSTINLSNNLFEGHIDPILDLLVENESGHDINAGGQLEEVYLHGNHWNGTFSFGVTNDLIPNFGMRNLTLHNNPDLQGNIGLNVCAEFSRPIISVDCTRITCDCCNCEA